MSQQRYVDSRHHLRDLVHTTLARSSYFTGTRLEVEVDEEQIVLKGVVRTYYQKQIAQESIRTIEGVTYIRNELQVLT